MLATLATIPKVALVIDRTPRVICYLSGDVYMKVAIATPAPAGMQHANAWSGRAVAMACMLVIVTLLGANAAQASLQVPNAQSLQQIGAGSLRKFGFHIYDASTWASTSSLPLDGSVAPPFALQIVYARRIEASDLVDATADAWMELKLFDADAKRWLQQVARLWPDVEAGDCLTLYVDDSGSATFYFNGRTLGHIHDPGFGPRFAAIWLHPNSREPSLRAQLLGLQTP